MTTETDPTGVVVKASKSFLMAGDMVSAAGIVAVSPHEALNLYARGLAEPATAEDMAAVMVDPEDARAGCNIRSSGTIDSKTLSTVVAHAAGEAQLSQSKSVADLVAERFAVEEAARQAEAERIAAEAERIAAEAEASE